MRLDRWRIPTDALLFALVLVIEVLFTAGFILSHRNINTHDAFALQGLTYYFFNNMVTAGEFPYWIPYLMQGSTATWWCGMEGIGGVGFLIFAPFAKLLQSVNYLTVYNLCVFMDRLILLTGVWLLGYKMFQSAVTRFFVAVSIMGSAVWMSQPGFNFHLFYAIPLILYFCHCWLETGRWRYAFLAAYCFLMQIFGNLAYFLPATSLTIFLYLFCYCCLHGNVFRNFLKSLKFDRNFALFCGGIAVVGGLTGLFLLTAFDKPNLVHVSEGRATQGHVLLESFLIYGSNMDGWKWLELWLGVTPVLDYTIFIGFLSLPCLIAPIVFRLGRHYLAIFLVGCVLFLFSMGTLVSVALYYTWPLMKYYRHLVLITPVLKLFLCFLAGFGFEVLFIHRDWLNRSCGRFLMKICAAAVIGWGISFYGLPDTSAAYNLVVSSLPDIQLDYLTYILDQGFLNEHFKTSGIFIILTGILIFMFALQGRNRFSHILVATLVLLHGFNMYSYYAREYHLRTAQLTDEQYRLYEFTPVSYHHRRTADWYSNSRTVLVDEFFDLTTVMYWIVNALAFHDEPGSFNRIERWQKPLDQLMRSFAGLPVNDESLPLPFGEHNYLAYPIESEKAQNLSGLAADKIQFFARAHPMSSAEEIGRRIGAPEYTGLQLFVEDERPSGDLDAISDERLELPYRVERFSANHLDLNVSNPTGRPVWLMYSDVWHPFWHVKVNEEEARLRKANLAYKAVEIPPGTSRVQFEFRLKHGLLLQAFWILTAIFWAGYVVRCIAAIIFFNPSINRIPHEKF